MLLGLLSPVSAFAGVATAVCAVIFLWPLNGFGAAVAMMAFAIGAGLAELMRRLSGVSAKPPTAHRADELPPAGPEGL
jgi:hypothetical protein